MCCWTEAWRIYDCNPFGLIMLILYLCHVLECCSISSLIQVNCNIIEYDLVGLRTHNRYVLIEIFSNNQQQLLSIQWLPWILPCYFEVIIIVLQRKFKRSGEGFKGNTSFFELPETRSCRCPRPVYTIQFDSMTPSLVKRPQRTETHLCDDEVTCKSQLDSKYISRKPCQQHYWNLTSKQSERK